MSDVRYEWRIDDPKAPPRLRGKVITAAVSESMSKLEFACDVPDDATPNETGYLRWSIGEFVDSLRAKLPGMIGDKTESLIPDQPRTS